MVRLDCEVVLVKDLKPGSPYSLSVAVVLCCYCRYFRRVRPQPEVWCNSGIYRHRVRCTRSTGAGSGTQITSPRSGRRNNIAEAEALTLTDGLVISKDERLILYNRPPGGPAKLSATEWGNLRAIEEIAGV